MPKRVLVLCVVLFLSFPSAVSAFSSTDSASPNTIRERIKNQVRSEVQPTRQVTKDQAQERVQEHVDEACQNVTGRIQNRINQYQTSKDKWMTRHQGVVKRLTSLSDKLAAKGCDATAIREDAEKYQVLVSNFAAAFRIFHDTLNDSRGYACGDGQGEFIGKLRQSRQEIQTVRTSAASLQDFFQTTLKLHLRQVGQTCAQTLEGTQ